MLRAPLKLLHGVCCCRYAVTDCVLFYINQIDFERIALKWPKAFAAILAKAKERLERVASVNSVTLASQLGDRLSEMNAELRADEMRHTSRLTHSGSASSFDVALRGPSAGERTTGVLPRLSTIGGGSSCERTTGRRVSVDFAATTLAARRPTAPSTAETPLPVGTPAGTEDLAWRGQLQDELRQTREVQHLLLKRLERQSELILALSAAQRPGGATAHADSSGAGVGVGVGSCAPNAAREQFPGSPGDCYTA